MKKTILCIFLFAVSAFAAEVDKSQLDLFKKESTALRGAIDDIMNATVAGRGLMESARATYLEGYGAVLTLQASLEPPRNPFNSPKTPAEVRAIVSERRKTIETKIEGLLKDRVEKMQSIAPTDSVTVVVYLFNSNPADVPDLPSQLVFTVKKQDPTHVVTRPF
jgi:hypothetical protein